MKTIMVTGASSGIGQKIATTLDNNGFRVLLVARNQDRLNSVASTLKNNPLTLSCDLSIPDELSKVDALIEPLKKEFCGLINNAGIYIQNDFINTTDKNWIDMFNTNLMAPVVLSKKAINYLKHSEQNHKFIVNISSTACARPIAGTSAYASLKSALNFLTKVVALEVADSKICVNSISPGIIDTPLHSFEKLDEASMQNINQLQPLQRVGQPKDIASMVQFLCDENNNWITGSNFTIDGGISLT